ncbi:hypothetical protein O181_113910 [Austropuccinia psidii MF-1]|uniref:Uncharacterized protein n=1 Tax=Austropuccinia psidii MF-1 TaxID=1389203 RepID=A0A9Q3K7E5_9BASI|nr:hypothetical protein [Austropuccinia psidii MF-1]
MGPFVFEIKKDFRKSASGILPTKLVRQPSPCSLISNSKYSTIAEPYDLSHEIVESSEDDGNKANSERNVLSDGDTMNFDISEEDKSDDGNLDSTEENQDSQARWTPDVDYGMINDFNKAQRNRNEGLFEEGLNKLLSQ